VTLLSAAPGQALGSGSTREPTRAQIAAAIRSAERSRDLWATVNICNTGRYPNVIGIRAQMPGLGFASQLDMAISVDYWSRSAKTFEPLLAATRSIVIGQMQSGVHQAGYTFRFSPHTGLLRGSVTFEWRLKHAVLARVTHKTSRGHADADFGDPRGHSAGTCVIL
jgi:hypothetical protein